MLEVIYGSNRQYCHLAYLKERTFAVIFTKNQLSESVGTLPSKRSKICSENIKNQVESDFLKLPISNLTSDSNFSDNSEQETCV